MKKSKYLLPNLFTSANLVSGFLSMIAAHNGQYAHAAWLSCWLRARLSGWQSGPFNAVFQRLWRGYDSLADLLSFGMAPGWLLYTGRCAH
jgi:CDP-diacylglycerol--serine O-phosphatidyltransferase